VRFPGTLGGSKDNDRSRMADDFAEHAHARGLNNALRGNPENGTAVDQPVGKNAGGGAFFRLLKTRRFLHAKNISDGGE